jgi:hypothetical protein
MLAVMLGHEFAHDVLHHRQREDRQGLALHLLKELDLSPATYQIEQEADYVGLYLTARAGYDITNAADVWRRLPEVLGQVSHPGHGEREASLEATRDEIFAKRERGEPLTPNWTLPASQPR